MFIRGGGQRDEIELQDCLAAQLPSSPVEKSKIGLALQQPLSLNACLPVTASAVVAELVDAQR